MVNCSVKIVETQGRLKNAMKTSWGCKKWHQLHRKIAVCGQLKEKKETVLFLKNSLKSKNFRPTNY